MNLKINLLITVFLILQTLLFSQSFQFNQISGSAIDIAISTDNTLYAIGTDSPNPNNTADGGIFKRTGNGWTRIAGWGLKIAVDQFDKPWIINSSKQIWRNNGGNSWTRIPGPLAADIMNDDAGNIYIIQYNPTGGEGQIHKFNGSIWVQTNRTATRAAITGDEGDYWMIKANGDVYRDGVFTNVKATEIDATGNDVFIIHKTHVPTNPNHYGNGYIHRWNGNVFKQFGGFAKDVAIRTDGAPTIINNNRYIFEFPDRPDNDVELSDFGYGEMIWNKRFPEKPTINVLMVMVEYLDTKFEPHQTASYYEKKYFSNANNNVGGFFDENSSVRDVDVNLFKTVSVQSNQTFACAHNRNYCPITIGGWGRKIEHANNGMIWVLNSHNDLYYRYKNGTNWNKAWHKAYEISVGSDLFFKHVNGKIYRKDFIGAHYDTGINATEFAADKNDRIYYKNDSNGLLYKATPASSTTYNHVNLPMPSGFPFLSQLHIEKDSLFILASNSATNAANGNGQVFMRTSAGTWAAKGQYVTNIKDLVADNLDQPWLIFKNQGEIKNLNDNNFFNYWGEFAIDLSFNSGGEVVFLDNDNVFLGDGTVKKWSRTNGNNGSSIDVFPGLLENALSPSDYNQFKSFDATYGDNDNVVEDDELMVVFVQALDSYGPTNVYGDAGAKVRAFPRVVNIPGPSGSPALTLAGEFSPIGDQTTTMTVTHEIAHLFGAFDLYGDYNNTRLSLMSSTGNEYFHLDAWHKMRMGFNKPTIVPITKWWRTKMHSTLFAASQKANFNPIIFYDPSKGYNEYFMVEFRRPEAWSYDVNVAGQGIVLWHVITDANHNLKEFKQLDNDLPSDKTLATLNAVDYKRGGMDVWTSAHATIAPKWFDGTDSKLRIKIDPNSDYYKHYLDWWTDGSDFSHLRTAQQQGDKMLAASGMTTDTKALKSVVSQKATFNRQQITVYPNPTTDLLTVQTDLAIEGLELYSVSGQLMTDYSSSDDYKQLNTELLAAGVYLLKVTTNDQAQTIRFVKQ